MSEQKSVNVIPLQDRRAIFIPSNLLSVLRLLILPFILMCLTREPLKFRYMTLGLIAISVLTDYFDGYFARKYDQISELGKILDPVIDKVSIDTMIIMLIPLRDLPLWVAFVAVGRDIAIVLAGLLVIDRRGIILSSDIWGKCTANILWGMILVYVFDLSFLKRPFVLLGMIFVGISLIKYGLRAFRTIILGEKAEGQDRVTGQYSDSTL